MKLYHGTQERNRRSIEVEGLYGSVLSEFTDGFTSDENGVLFVTSDINEAREYGDLVCEILEFDVEKVIPFNDGNTSHYYIEIEHIRDECDYLLIS